MLAIMQSGPIDEPSQFAKCRCKTAIILSQGLKYYAIKRRNLFQQRQGTFITMLFPEKTAASIGLKILWKG